MTGEGDDAACRDGVGMREEEKRRLDEEAGV